jgi:hypothetical protein
MGSPGATTKANGLAALFLSIVLAGCGTSASNQQGAEGQASHPVASAVGRGIAFRHCEPSHSGDESKRHGHA